MIRTKAIREAVIELNFSKIGSLLCFRILVRGGRKIAPLEVNTWPDRVMAIILGMVALRVLAMPLIAGALAHGAVIYSEAISGDFSNSGLTPTPVTVSAGSNQIFGTTGNVGGTDRDYFTFSVP